MPEKKLYQAVCKKCGGKVTSEWKDYNTYPGVIDENGDFIHGFEDESVYTSDTDKNETGIWCEDCGEYLSEDEVKSLGREYQPILNKKRAVMSALELLRDMYEVDFVRNVFGDRIDEAQFILANEFGLVEAKEAPDEMVPGEIIGDNLLIDDLEE